MLRQLVLSLLLMLLTLVMCGALAAASDHKSGRTSRSSEHKAWRTHEDSMHEDHKILMHEDHEDLMHDHKILMHEDHEDLMHAHATDGSRETKWKKDRHEMKKAHRAEHFARMRKKRDGKDSGVEGDAKIGRRKHDEHRRRELWEDESLPVPLEVHSLGYRLHHDDSTAHEGLESEVGVGFRRKLSANGPLSSLLTPLYQGYGTHFSYIYIGTPPQRQSVIVDTGSHYTAFPCTGCEQCGAHTDSYWNPELSSTVEIQKCSGAKCSFGQSYSEGSSWRAYKVIDKLWVGGISPDTVPTGSQYAIDFMFGCQTSETGLFRTQLADGIMGMAMASDTLPSQLVEQKVAASNIFALCFRVGGGIMTLGGVDQRIHKSVQGVSYAEIKSTDGWYTITVMDIQLVDRRAAKGTNKSLGGSVAAVMSGKGTIVDSGTTDTYLPQAIKADFQRVFKEVTGIEFSTANTAMSEADLAKMPDIVFVVKGSDGQPFNLIMPWTNYIDKVGNGMYAFRVYLSEGSGAVLGANLMNGFNVIFDKANKRVGFAKSDCVYEEFITKRPETPTFAPSVAPGTEPDKCKVVQVPVSECTARCTVYQEEAHAYTKKGTQIYEEACEGFPPSAEPKTIEKACDLSCNGSKIVRGVDTCPEKAWNPCLKSCIQSRDVPLADDLAKNICTYQQQTRTCYSGDCPMQDGDILVFIDMRVGVPPSMWSYVYSDVFYGAMASIFSVPAQNIELLNDARTEYYLSAKLHFQIRLKAKDYKSKKELTAAAQAIPVLCWKENFGYVLISALEAESRRIDQINFSRYGYLNPVNDVEVLNAVALPIGDVRDPIDIPRSDDVSDQPQIVQKVKEVFQGREEYFFIGVAISMLMLCCCLMWLYLRLHREKLALAKEKVQGSTLMRMLQKVKGWQSGKNVEFGADGGHMYSEVQMGDASGSGVNAINPLHDDELDDEDVSDV